MSSIIRQKCPIILHVMKVLKDLRAEHNLTQQQLAQAIGTNAKTITRWENGQSEPSAFCIVKLARFFHVSTDYILGLEDDLGQKTYINLQETMSPEEEKIINAYRKLSGSGREMLMRILNI